VGRDYALESRITPRLFPPGPCLLSLLLETVSATHGHKKGPFSWSLSGNVLRAFRFIWLGTPAPPSPPPDPKLLAVQARTQVDAAIATQQAQLQHQKAQDDAIHLQVKTQGEIEVAKIKAALDAKMALLEAHLKVAIETGKAQRPYPPGARKARDDHHYVPDPKRPGKYP
jgi:hypothetical protein